MVPHVALWAAHVVGVHEPTGRYDVALSATQTLRLKKANVRA